MSKYIDKDKVLEYIIFGVVGKDITCGDLARGIESLPTIEVSDDCISRQQVVKMVHKYFVDAIDKTSHEIDEDGYDVYTDMKAVNELLKHNKHISKAIKALPPVTPTVKVRQVDTLIIAAALRDFAQNSERNISDRERAEELREQVLECGASMCNPVTPTERTGEWIRRKDGGATCSRCGVMLGKGQWTNYDGIPDYYCRKCGAKMGGDME